MSKVYIGTAGRKPIGFDLDLLLPERLLITADSGGGKSYVIRKLLEQLYGKVQSIVIDPEGEFASLREKFPFVLVGQGGETAADPRSAKMLAQRLIELRASAICDLYEMKASDRHLWVKNFIEGLIEIPKRLWTPCVVVIDEAHMFCPEKGKGESQASGAMIDLCTKGRKRGLCAVWATQSLAKVDKDGSGMLRNRLIGPTWEDVNRKRAAEILSIEPGKPTRAFFDEIKLLEPGNFFALGRSIAKERVLIHIGEVQTTHPKAFQKHTAPPPPAPEKIRALLPKLADLPREAEQKQRTEAELRAEIRQLRQSLANVERVATAERAHLAPNPAELRKAIAAAMKPLEAFQQLAIRQTKAVAKNLADASIQIEKVFAGAVGALDKITDAAAHASPAASPATAFATAPSPSPREPHRPVVAIMRSPVAVLPVRGGPAESDGQVKTKRDRLILSALATHGPCSKFKLAILTGYASDGGGFNNGLGSLRTAGYITPLKVEPIAITDAGTTAIGTPDPIPQGRELFNFWLNHPTMGHGEKEILRVLSETLRPLTKEEIAAMARAPGGEPYEPTGGGFNNKLGKLRTLGVIEGYAQIQLCEELSQAASEAAI